MSMFFSFVDMTLATLWLLSFDRDYGERVHDNAFAPTARLSRGARGSGQPGQGVPLGVCVRSPRPDAETQEKVSPMRVANHFSMSS